MQRYAFTFDHFISDKAQQDIVAYIEANSLSTMSATDSAGAIKKTFPFVRSTTISYLPTGICHLAIKAQRPQCIINNVFVMTRTGDLHDKDLFMRHMLALVPPITVSFEKDQQVLPALLHDVVTNVPAQLFALYNFEWVTEHSIVLHDKINPHFAVTCTADHLPTAKMLRGCAQIKQLLCCRDAFRYNNSWVADIRFADQIVVYKALGGLNYGTGIK